MTSSQYYTIWYLHLYNTAVLQTHQTTTNSTRIQHGNYKHYPPKERTHKTAQHVLRRTTKINTMQIDLALTVRRQVRPDSSNTKDQV